MQSPQTPPVPNKPIPVGGGLVDASDPSMLAIGELQTATDAYYKPTSQTIWSVPGRNAFNDAPESGPIVGAVFCAFDSLGGTVSAQDYIITHLGPKLRKANAGFTGTFSDLLTGLYTDPITHLSPVVTCDVVYFENKYIFFDGVNRNQVIEPGAVIRNHGMLSNTAPPVVTNTGAGTGFTLSSGKTVKYWIEERVKNAAGDILRRNGTPGLTEVATLTGSGAVVKPVVARPDPQVNPDATHWALYATATNGAFPTGAQIAEVAIAVATIEDTRTGTDPLIPSGDVYETVATNTFGIVETFSKWGPPPICRTMDIQEGSAVCDDINDPTLLHYAFPGEPDAWPYPFVIRIWATDGGGIKWVRLLGGNTIVGLEHQLWRVNSLPQPSATDAFSTTNVQEKIMGAFGGVGPQAVASFSFGQGELLAYVSPAGIVVTDGSNWDVATNDIDWPNDIDVSQLSRSILRNNESLFRLEFVYTPIGGALNSRTFFLCYHPNHVKVQQIDAFRVRQRVKVTGPISRGALCTVNVVLNGQEYIFSGQSNGVLYQEWTGVTDPLGDINFDVRTGDLFPGGIGRHARVRRVWTHHQAGAPGQRVNFNFAELNEGKDPREESITIPFSRREHTSSYRDLQAEAFQFGISATNPPAPIGVDFFVADFEDQGESTAEGEA